MTKQMYIILQSLLAFLQNTIKLIKHQNTVAKWLKLLLCIWEDKGQNSVCKVASLKIFHGFPQSHQENTGTVPQIWL